MCILVIAEKARLVEQVARRKRERRSRMLAARLTNDAVRDWAPGCDEACQNWAKCARRTELGWETVRTRCRRVRKAKLVVLATTPAAHERFRADGTMASNLTQPYPCDSHTCSPNSVCCGLDPNDNKYYCASHCSCANNTQSAGGWNIDCFCDPGFHGIDCAQQMSPTVWLAVILSVGTLLVLFIAWGFRCGDEPDVTEIGPTNPESRRAPLLREGAGVAAAAARPPTETCRPTGEMPSSTDVSCVGAGTGADTSLQRRTCCVCLSKPLQVVLIPCGHACLCRRCSRKLDKCPLCRLDIQATQRFYF